jgi:HEAT repeat protein
LVAALADTQESVRVRAARELGERGTAAKAAVKALAEAWLDDSSAEVRSEAVRALARIGPASLSSLLPGLRSESSLVRVQAVGALTRLGPDADWAVPELRAALRDGSPEVRGLSAAALGAVGLLSCDAVPDLVRLLTDEPPVRAQALAALVQIGDAAVPALADGLKDARPVVRAACAKALALLGADAARALPALRGALADRDPKVRASAAAALGAQGGAAAPATADLISLLKDPDPAVQSRAVEALLRIGPAAVPALADAARPGPDVVVRALAVTLLGEMGLRGRDAVPTLAAVAREKTPGLPNLAVLALGRIGPAARDARPDLRILRDDPDTALRAGAALALARIDPSDAEAAVALQNEFVKIAGLSAAAAGQSELQNQLAVRRQEDLAAAAADARRKAAEAAEARRKAAENARQNAGIGKLMNLLLLADQASLSADQLSDLSVKLAQLNPTAIPYVVQTANQLLATPSVRGELAQGMDFT